MFYFKFQQHPGESVDKVIYFHKYFIYVDNQVSILEFYVLGTNCYFDVLITGTEEKKKKTKTSTKRRKPVSSIWEIKTGNSGNLHKPSWRGAVG